MAAARRAVGGRRLPRADLPARPAGHRPARVHDRRLLRDRGPVVERAARLRRADLARPCGVRRHRCVHVGLPHHRPGAVVLGRRARRHRDRRRPGTGARRRVPADPGPLLRPDHALLRPGRRAEHLRDPGVHRRRGGAERAEARLVRIAVAVLLPVPRLPGRRALRRLADDAQQGWASTTGPAGESPRRLHVRHQRAAGDAVRLRRLGRDRRPGRGAHRQRTTNPSPPASGTSACRCSSSR